MGLELTHAIAINLETFVHDSVSQMGYSLLNQWMVCARCCMCCVYLLYVYRETIHYEYVFLHLQRKINEQTLAVTRLSAPSGRPLNSVREAQVFNVYSMFLTCFNQLVRLFWSGGDLCR